MSKKFSEEKYREIVIKLADVGKFVQGIDEPDLGEVKLFILHYIQILGGQLRDLQHIMDIKENPHKMSTEVTPHARDEKPKLTIPGTLDSEGTGQG